MPNNKIDFLTEIAEYYTTKITEHGETFRGVDWNSEEGQILRFEQNNTARANFSIYANLSV